MHISKSILIIALPLILGCAQGTTWVKPNSNLSQIRKIAVLPFQSNKAGLGDEIANRFTVALLQLNRFEVIESSTVLNRIREKTGEPQRIESATGESGPAGSPIDVVWFSETLGVDAVMTGSIRRYGNWFVGKDMNIDLKLVTKSGSIVWTCNYKTDWAFTGLGTEGSLASKIVKEAMKRFRNSYGL